MRIRRLSLHRLDPASGAYDAVVVIDVLRSFTTAACAFAAGAVRIHPVETIAEGHRLRALLPQAIATGAVGGGDPISGFDCGNSPSLISRLPLAGKTLIQCTAAGTRGLARFAHARHLFAGSLVCARATAAALRAAAPRQVTLVTTGEWIDRDGDEDIACADYLEALLSGANPAAEIYQARVRNSDFGRRFLAADNENLPRADLEICASADRFDFAMPVRRQNGRAVIVAQRPALPGAGGGAAGD